MLTLQYKDNFLEFSVSFDMKYNFVLTFKLNVLVLEKIAIFLKFKINPKINNFSSKHLIKYVSNRLQMRATNKII